MLAMKTLGRWQIQKTINNGPRFSIPAFTFKIYDFANSLMKTITQDRHHLHHCPRHPTVHINLHQCSRPIDKSLHREQKIQLL